MTPEEKQQRADWAAQVLSNPAYLEALAITKGKLFDEWCTTKWFQVRKREKIWGMMNAAESLERTLNKRLNDGKVIKMHKEHTERQRKLK